MQLTERIETSDNAFAVRQTQHGDDEVLLTRIIECQHRSVAFACCNFTRTVQWSASEPLCRTTVVQTIPESVRIHFGRL